MAAVRYVWLLLSTALIGLGIIGQFAFYYPKVYRYYSTNLRKLFNRHTYLKHCFNCSIFPACTFNCTNTITLKCVDDGNYFAGACPIYSGGNYDPKLGKHIILFDLKLIIEFPPASTVIIPSSTISHGNTPIQPGETRVSFTQYCAGGLFRWVGYGFQTLKTCAEKYPLFKNKVDKQAQKRWHKALNWFSKVSEVHNDRIKNFKL
jgi:hypothetical protein